MKKFYCIVLMLLLATVISNAQQTQTLKELSAKAGSSEYTRHTSIQPMDPVIPPAGAREVEGEVSNAPAVPTFPASQEVTVPSSGEFSAHFTGGGSRDVTDLECPTNSLYSQTPDGVNAWSYVGGYAFYDNVLITPLGSITSITWWMSEEDVEPSLTFDIIIRPDNAGEPNMGVTKYVFSGLVAGVDVTVTNTGEIPWWGDPVYEYTYQFPFPLNIIGGDWVGIADFPDNGFHHYWLTSSDGDNQMYLPDGDYFESTDLSFCLQGRISDLVCPTESVFSQLPAGLGGWTTAVQGFEYDNVYNPTNTPMAVGSLTWWMQPDIGSTTPTFDIVVREDNSGEPGALIYSFNDVTATETSTGEFFGVWETYEYTYNFPSMLIIDADDWIGISYDPATYGYHFWCISREGDGQHVFTNDDIVYGLNVDDFAFCLGAYEYNLFCPDESVYAQIPIGLDGWSTTDGFVFYDNILSPTYYPIGSITWWMLERTLVPTLTFDIIFREDNGGIPGNIIASFTGLTVPGVNTGEIGLYQGGWPIYEYTYTFPTPVELDANDWVGIADYPDDLGVFHHYWCMSDDGDGQIYGLDSGGSGYFYTPDLAFCLSPAPIIPISNWAIGIGIFLIIAFTVLRFRKLF